eukprot:6754569-Prymnesium_polylepis.1
MNPGRTKSRRPRAPLDFSIASCTHASHAVTRETSDAGSDAPFSVFEYSELLAFGGGAPPPPPPGVDLTLSAR